MTKKELKEQLKSYEGYINDIPLVIDPCRQCHAWNKEKEEYCDIGYQGKYQCWELKE